MLVRCEMSLSKKIHLHTKSHGDFRKQESLYGGFGDYGQLPPRRTCEDVMTDTKQIIKQFLKGYKINVPNVVGNPFRDDAQGTKSRARDEIIMEGDKRP